MGQIRVDPSVDGTDSVCLNVKFRTDNILLQIVFCVCIYIEYLLCVCVCVCVCVQV